MSGNRAARVVSALITVAVVVALCVVGTSQTTASAAPNVVSVKPLGGRQLEVVVYSAAMNRQIPLWMSHPGTGAPALYLLNGVDGGEQGSAWTGRSDVAGFFADKNVNVIVPLAGRASFYTDWASDDPVLGRNKWATFLTDELPPLLNARFGMTGRNAIAGISMSATSALDLAIHSPGLYEAVGSYSGCVSTSAPLTRAIVYAALGIFGANAGNMWGAPDDPAWGAHDPLLHADWLRGVSLYISSGTGTPGTHDALNSPGINGNVAALIDRLSIGGVMEAVANECTKPLAARLRSLDIPATVVFRAGGTHAWPYWQDDLHQSWAIFAPAIGA